MGVRRGGEGEGKKEGGERELEGSVPLSQTPGSAPGYTGHCMVK